MKSSGTGLPVAGDVVDTGGIVTDDYEDKECTVDVYML